FTAENCFNMLVSSAPGCKTFTLMLCWATAIASASENATMAPFEAIYDCKPGLGLVADTDPILIIEPFSFFFIYLIASLHVKNTPVALIAMIFSHSFRDTSSIGVED